MNGGEVSGDKLQRAYRIRIAFFLVCVMAVSRRSRYDLPRRSGADAAERSGT